MCDMSFAKHMCKNIGETVTIFTEGGGESGRGFTGILLDVNKCYVRLTTQVGPAPGCALGNCCSYRDDINSQDNYNYNDQYGRCEDYGDDEYTVPRRNLCNARTVGSISDIPICKIVAFVHNSLNN